VLLWNHASASYDSISIDEALPAFVSQATASIIPASVPANGSDLAAIEFDVPAGAALGSTGDLKISASGSVSGRLGLLGPGVEHGQAQCRGPVLWIRAAHQQQAAVRIVIALGVQIGEAQAQVHRLVVGLELGGLLEQRDGFVAAAFFQLEQLCVVARLEVRGRRRQRRLEVFERGVLLAAGQPHGAQVVARRRGLGVLRGQLERLGVDRQRVVLASHVRVFPVSRSRTNGLYLS
jgi:hypothetical protein